LDTWTTWSQTGRHRAEAENWSQSKDKCFEAHRLQLRKKTEEENVQVNLAPSITVHADRPTYWVVGDRYIFLLTSKETGGQFSLFDFTVPPGRGSPPHIHRNEDETFVVLEGEAEFTVAGQPHRVGKGQTVFGPRGVPHNFRNVGETPLRMLVMTTPGGLDEFFAAAGQPAPDQTTLPPPPNDADKARMLDVAGRYGIELIAPPHP
jgi:mannose-6-phosphate isomerase-like protein (cupin superfamily)